MPRISAEERAAAAFRAGGERPEPPKGLVAAARALWVQIVSDRPIDYFRPGQLHDLADYCAKQLEGERITRELVRTRIGGEDYLALQKLAARNTAMVMALGTKLRLTVQAGVDGRSKKTDERGDASADDGLIGGTAVRGKLRVVSRNS